MRATKRSRRRPGLGCCLVVMLGGLSLMRSLPCRAAPQQQKDQAPTELATANGSDEAPFSSSIDSKANDSKADDPENSEVDNNALGMDYVRHLVSDQEDIWTSPFHVRWGDTAWLLPLGEVTAGFIETDAASARALSNNPKTLNRYRSFSDYSLAAYAGAAGGLYVLGKFTHDDHKRETGVLASEAMIDSFAVNSALNYAFGRERPYQDQGQGLFFQGGSSFPSDHSMLAWSAASVIAHEYPGTLTELLAYGGATAISASRVMGKEHFSSDVLVGSALGWLIGYEVYRKHHDPELGGSGWSDLSGGIEGER